MANTKARTLIQALVIRHPITAAARLMRNKKAKIREANGPVPGNIPRNTPSPNPSATFCGESSILKSFKYTDLRNSIIFFKSVFLKRWLYVDSGKSLQSVRLLDPAVVQTVAVHYILRFDVL